MNLIIREAKVVNLKSPFHNQIVDIKIKDKRIEKIGINLAKTSGYQELKLDNIHVSEGWFDCSVSLGEPGFEDRETIFNGLDVAAKSGFTAIALQPNTNPIIDNQSQINFVINKAKDSATELFPIGSFTKESDGKNMAELYDMRNAGAVAFGDYNKNIDNANLLKIGLQYLQDFNGLLLTFCQDTTIKSNGVVNEGIISTKMGLKGIPNLAEELQLSRNLLLLEYTKGKMHVPTISTAQSVELIRNAKAQGLNVTCSVAVHNLVLTDEKIDGFDTRFKVEPPLRTEEDRRALLAGILDDTIDMITSDHNPIDIEHKKMEFDGAKNGTIGLESAFGALTTVLSLEKVIEKLTAGKSTFSIENSVIKEGSIANITLFNPNGNWTFNKENILSKSKNSAFIGNIMKGKVYGIYNKGILVLA